MERGRRLRLISVNTTIALLLGLLLLSVSYWGVSDYVFWRDLTHEIGFALVVAVTIWSTYEFFTQSETEDQWNNRIETITRNVFFGVFKRNFPTDFIKEANVLVLDQVFIREDLHVSYTISDGQYADRTGAAQTFVKLNAVARYKVSNVGNKKETFPIGVGLPNPLIDEMKPFCKVHAITIKKGGSEIKADLTAAEQAFREAIKDDKQHQIAFKVVGRDLGPSQGIDLAPGEMAEIIIDYAMAKEQEDTEIFQTLYPAASAIVTIMDKGHTPRVVRARSIHVAPLENDTSAEVTGTYNFKLDRYLLPHQGFAIWWKRVPAGVVTNSNQPGG
jgi:hypothetical protein